MKKRTYNPTSPADNQPSGPSSGSDPSTQTLEELQEQNKELRRRLQKHKGEALFFPRQKKNLTFQTTEKKNSTRSESGIKPITRPKGEAGSRKWGFILYTAMGMDTMENGAVVYDRMRVCACRFFY